MQQYCVTIVCPKDHLQYHLFSLQNLNRYLDVRGIRTCIVCASKASEQAFGSKKGFNAFYEESDRSFCSRKMCLVIIEAV